jgi:hypothetical protein
MQSQVREKLSSYVAKNHAIVGGTVLLKESVET